MVVEAIGITTLIITIISWIAEAASYTNTKKFLEMTGYRDTALLTTATLLATRVIPTPVPALDAMFAQLPAILQAVVMIIASMILCSILIGTED